MTPIWLVLLYYHIALALAPQTSNVQHEVESVVSEMNRLRQAKGTRPLCNSEKLARSAYIQSKYQSEVAQMTHDNPLDIAGRMLAVGFAVNQGRAGENVGKDSELNGLKMMQSWQNSPSHYENIVDPKYNFVGVSAVQSTTSKHEWYWTVHFAQGAENEVCREDSILNPHNYDPSMGDEEKIDVKSSIVANLNDRIKILLASDDNKNIQQSHQTPQTMAILTDRAIEFTPPTVTETRFQTVSFVSTRFVPTTIVSLVTMATTCPIHTCSPPPPCICLPNYTAANTTSTVNETATVLILSNSMLTTTTIMPPRQSKLVISSPTAVNQIKTVYHCPSLTTVYKCSNQK